MPFCVQPAFGDWEVWENRDQAILTQYGTLVWVLLTLKLPSELAKIFSGFY